MKKLLIFVLIFVITIFLLQSCKKNITNEDGETELNTGTVTDIDGTVYQTIKIGNQWWMAENLNVIHYRNGDNIPNVTNIIEWPNLVTGAYCNYNNNSNNVITYGRLYNWYAVGDMRNIAPSGWHVPSKDEWQTLIDYLGGTDVAGGKMKDVDTGLWDTPNEGATNESCFTGLPSGYRTVAGFFSGIGKVCYFWSSGESYSKSAISIRSWYLRYYSSQAFAHDNQKRNAFSVRCIKD